VRGHTCKLRERRGAGPTTHGADGREWRKGTERERLPKVKMSRTNSEDGAEQGVSCSNLTAPRILRLTDQG